MNTISKKLRHLIEPVACKSKTIGYIYFYLRARELGFRHGKITRIISNIRK